MDTFEIAQLMTDSTHQHSPKIRYGVVASLDAGIAITVRLTVKLTPSPPFVAAIRKQVIESRYW